MTDMLKGQGNGLSSASTFQGWIADYARGCYTEVVRSWVEARERFPTSSWSARPDLAEAIGWSLALTKAWEPYADFRADLLGSPAHADLLAVLDAWHAIHESRYDAAVHGARALRGSLLGAGAPARSLGFALRVEGVALLRIGRYLEAETLTRAALEIFQMAGDPLHVSHCATNLGLILNARGELPAARAALQRSVDALVEADAAGERLALAHVNLAVVELHLGHVEAARGLFESSLATFEALQLRSEQITALNGLGHCARALGRFDAALAHHKAALRRTGPELARQIGLCHEFIGQVHFDRGDRARAEAHYRRAMEIAASIAPDGDLMCEISWRYGELLVAAGRVDAAREQIERAESLCAANHDRRELGCVQRVRARILSAEGDTTAAAMFDLAFVTSMQTGRVLEAALARLAQADCDLARGERSAAAVQLDAARALLEERLAGSAWVDRAEAALEQLRGAGVRLAGGGFPARHGIVTRDADWIAMLDDLATIAATPYPVLLEGESGTGKELMARAVHTTSGRSGAWMAINCAAVPRDLFESELFGHARGAFSGAQGEKPGLFELAAGGTLFLDEIGEMPLELQSKLLRVLDDGEVRRVGEVRQRTLSVKIVAATNRPLEPMVAAGTFRADLFHRLAVHALRLKPLRDRREDIEILAHHFVRREALEGRFDMTPEFVADLESRPWSGNARELRNFLVRAATQRHAAAVPSAATLPASLPASLRATRSSHERRVIETALAASGGSVAVAARTLRLHVTTLRRKMRALGVERPA